ncbi:hypothetical protein HRG_009889 [Hirsutella rhossiliensis]|uniref:Uncharacterized protein n=1 Tax=Hirsutella rhossiliensis TaxID=111463 RepID=A0A9P8MQX5_9HYPO|nr:uncharacterized protein HRG_09889 [Hirsutella rhossiliensis]KAH0958844.1 hypothetical protein HRG_09889 [Hirsutella rhossiliensis]
MPGNRSAVPAVPLKGAELIQTMNDDFKVLEDEAGKIKTAADALVSKLKSTRGILGRERLLDKCKILSVMSMRFQDELKDIREDCKQNPERAEYYKE